MPDSGQATGWRLRRKPMKSKQIWLGLGLILTLVIFSGVAWAGDGALDPSFNHFTGVSKIPMIRGQANWTDSNGYATGNSLIFGYFTSITDSKGQHPVSSIAKLTDFNGTVDTNFNNGTYWTINGEVHGAFMSNPGAIPNSTQDIIIWGTFSLTSGSTTYYNLARLTWNTSDNAYVVDTTFPQIFSLVDNGTGTMVSGVNAVALMGSYLSSYVLVGGYNMQVQGDTTHAYHLIRLNTNFTYDSTYTNAKSLPGGDITAIHINSSNEPRLFGTLPQGNGTYHWWEAYGSNLVTLQQSLGDQSTSGINYGPIDGPIFSMAQTSTNQWIIGGVFQNVFGTGLNHVAQLNSSLTGRDDTNAFNTNIHNGGGSKGAVLNIIMQGGQPILSGNLVSFNVTPCGRLVRLNYSGTIGGTVDTSFVSAGSPTAGADDRINRLESFATSPTGSYLQILGAFQHYNGTARGGIATLNPSDGSLYASNYPSPFAANSNTPGTVYAMDTVYVSNGQTGQSDIVIGGDFTGVNGKYHQNLAYLNLDGSLDSNFPITVFEGQVNAIRGLDNGSVLVAGNFVQAQGYGCTSLARLNSNSGFDTTFRPIVVKGNGLVAGLRLVNREDSGQIDIGGNFATVYDSSHNPQSRNAFARLNSDGTLDPSFNAQISITGGTKIKVNAGGPLGSNYGMGGYVSYNGNDYGFGCVLGPSGTQITNLLFNGEVFCGTGLSDGRILLGGNFTQVAPPQGPSRGHIVALTSNFTVDNSSFAGAGANGPIYALQTEGDNNSGKPLIGGAFSTYNGVGRNKVARLNLDGSLDTSFNPGTGANGPVHAISWYNNRAGLGGAFTSYNGTTMPGLAQVFASFGVNLAPNYLLLLGN
jgi:hypothetical protein